MQTNAQSEFEMDRESMRQFGYAVVDRIVEHYAALSSKPANRIVSREELEKRLRTPLPTGPSPAASVLDQVTGTVFAAIGHLNHPRFFGFIPTPGNFISAMADALASGYTPFCGSWREGSGPAVIELVTLDWLRELFGLPSSAGGLFLSGGSLANLTALAAARDSRPEPHPQTHVYYCSAETHASIDRALRILGYRPDQLRRLPADEHHRLRPRDLASAIAADRDAGATPFCVVANAGTTSTGAIDPLPALAGLCSHERLWLHVDGAYGAAAIFSPRHRHLLAGIGLADSLSLDPHKWLFQTYPLGCVLVRDRRWLRNAFHYGNGAAYLQDTEPEGGEINFYDYGPELTRPFRALKLWMSLQVFGADAFARAIDQGFAMAEFTERTLRARPQWEVVSPATAAIVAFRHLAPGLPETDVDALNRRIADEAAEDGCCFESTTVIGGRTVQRFCTIQPTTTEEDIVRSLDCLEKIGARLTAG